jgi:SAM-dependent methyltransferase
MITKIKKGVKKLIRLFYSKKPKKKIEFPGSKKYWEERYKADRNSGSGSYGRLAAFKAEVLNNFVIAKEIPLVIELGSGDGNQLALAAYPHYKGFDVSETAVNLCREKFKKDNSKEFFLLDDSSQENAQATLVLSLDVLYHLIEDSVFDEYMHRLFNMSSKYVIIYSSNYDDHFAPHVKCRMFTKWIEANNDDKWKLIEVIKNKYPFDAKDPDNTSMADFYIYQKQ